MFFRLVCVLFAALIGAGLCGCYSTAEGQLDDQKNPYFMAAKDRVSARDYKGAIELFEKALEVNPRSALAHFELGVLYEQRDEHENHFISAMYHYKRAIDLRPHGSPADIAKQRMAGCKQELVKSESLAPVYQAMQRDFDKLKEENQFFRKQVEGLQVQLTNRMAELRMQSQSQNQTPQGPIGNRPPTISSNRNETSANNRPNPVPSGWPRVTPLPPVPGATKTHTIKQKDTLAAIARAYSIKLDALLAANPGIDAKHLKVGQAVKIPST